MAEPSFDHDLDQRELESALISKWAQLERYLEAALGRIEPMQVGVEPNRKDVLQLWATLFSDEIEAVRRARNLVVHLPSTLPKDDLVEANEFGVRLLDLLQRKLSEAS